MQHGCNYEQCAYKDNVWKVFTTHEQNDNNKWIVWASTTHEINDESIATGDIYSGSVYGSITIKE